MIDKVLTEKIEKEFDDLLQKLQNRKCEIVAGLLLNIKKEIDIQTVGEKTIFTIREIKK